MYTYARTYVRTYITANTNLLYYNCVTILTMQMLQMQCWKGIHAVGADIASHKMVLQALQISIDGHTNVVTK